jgi:hypothetical protein
MFLSSYEKLRCKLQTHDTVNMAHLGARAFAEIGGEVVQSTAFVMRGRHISGYKGVYVRLVDIDNADGKEREFLNGNHRHTADSANFAKIPSSPVAYWVGETMLNVFSQPVLKNAASVQEGLKTADNNRFIRKWYEVELPRTNIRGNPTGKWFHTTKGGEFRRWYGNCEDLLNYENDGAELRAFKAASLTGTQNYFKENLTWSRITSGRISFRYTSGGSIPNMAGLACYPDSSTRYILGYLNTKIASNCVDIMNPTLNYPPGTVANIPFSVKQNVLADVESIVEQNISLSRADWDDFETSWDFLQHPLLPGKDEVSHE